MNIQTWIEQLGEQLPDNAFEISDRLAENGGEEVKNAMVALLKHSNLEARVIAARTLGLIQDNDDVLEPLLDAINDKANENIAGDLMVYLETFDLSESYVNIFKCYLFGSFKVSTQAKEFMDYKEFNITSRVLKKVKKQWNHYVNNVKHDELFELTKLEVDEIIEDLESYLNDA